MFLINNLTDGYTNIILILYIFIVVIYLLFNKTLLLMFLYIFIPISGSLCYTYNTKLNIQLINGFYFYHPFLFSVLIAMLIFILYLFIVYYSYIDFYKYYNYIYMLLLVNIIMLISGAYWAQQELNWGGWWFWDPVEIINLTHFLFLFLISHLILNNFIIINYFLWTLYFIFIVRYGLLDSIHSFLITNSISQYKYYIYYNWLLIFYIMCFYLYISIIRIKINYIILSIYILLSIQIILLLFNLTSNFYSKFIFIYLYYMVFWSTITNNLLPIIFFFKLNLHIKFIKYKILHIFIFVFIFVLVFNIYEYSTYINFIFNSVTLYCNFINTYLYIADFYKLNYNINTINFSMLDILYLNYFIDYYNIFKGYMLILFNRSFLNYNIINLNLLYIYICLYFLTYIVFIYLVSFKLFIKTKLKLIF